MAKLIPRNISYTHNAGRLLVDLSCEKLVTQASMAYEVTCPNEPDNDPEQPQDEKPTEPTWPDIGEGDVLTRNSFRSGNLFESVDDPIAVKSVVGIGATPKVAQLNGGGAIDSNVVSSNNYVYWIDGLVAYRKAIKSGKTDKSFSLTDYDDDYPNITLVEENVIVRVVREIAADRLHLVKVDFTNETETEIASIISYVEDDYQLHHAYTDGVFTIEGSDGKLYIIIPNLKYIIPAVGDIGYTDAWFYIYNYTDDVLYDPVVLDIWDTAGVNDITTVWMYEAPAIIQSEIVFTFHINFDSGFDYDKRGFPLYCINVETQTGQAVYQSSYSYNGTVYVPDYQYRMVSDRMYRKIYIVLFCDAYNPSDTFNDDFPIWRYDLASNSVDIESHHPRRDAPGTGAVVGNLPWLCQDKDHAYKFTNLYCADTTGNPDYDKTNCLTLEPMFSRIENGYSVDLYYPIKLPYLPNNEYDIDDVTGDLYTIVDSGGGLPIIWVNYYARAINVLSATDADKLHIQGDHILLVDSSARVFWVVYP